jgi:hypothetical protein
MHKWAILFGVILVALGLNGYFGGTDSTAAPAAGNVPATAPADAAAKPASLTALIPAAFGALLLVCGLVGANEQYRKNAMHSAAGIAALGVILGGGRFLMKISSLFDESSNKRALIFTGLLGLICLIYLVLSIQSFMNARRQREASVAKKG